jgi:hypothetical protein
MKVEGRGEGLLMFSPRARWTAAMMAGAIASVEANLSVLLRSLP